MDWGLLAAKPRGFGIDTVGGFPYQILPSLEQRSARLPNRLNRGAFDVCRRLYVKENASAMKQAPGDSRLARFAAVIFALTAAAPVQADLQIDLKSGLDMNWYYYDDDPGVALNFLGYYRNYGGDNLPDFLVMQQDLLTENPMRIFTLDTTPTGGAKSFPADKTAGRDIAVQPGVFYPVQLHLPMSPAMDSPDLVVHGVNGAGPNGVYSQIIFKRLDKTNPAFPDQATFAVDVNSSHSPQVQWASSSYNDDAYPDVFVYNSNLNDADQFVVGCYDGLTGAVIWTQAFDKDPEDTGSLIPGLAVSYCSPYLLNSRSGGSGDFNNDVSL